MNKVILLIGFMASVIMLSSALAATVITGEEKMGMLVEWTFNSSDQFPGLSFGAGHQGPPSIFDADGDSKMEIYYGTRRGDSKREWCLNGDGTLKWIYPAIGDDPLPGDPTSKMSFVDVDNDGAWECCLSGRGGRLHVINPDGTVQWWWDNPAGAGAAMHGAPQAYDVDGDGYVEFFMNDGPGFIHRIDHEGNLVWSSAAVGDDNEGQPTIADIDRDSTESTPDYEILFACQDGNMYCLDANTGNEDWRFPTGANMQTNQVIVADVNGDDEYEAICWNEPPPPDSGTVFVVTFFGIEYSRWTCPYEGHAVRLCQTLGDVDGDGSYEMAIMSSGNIYVIDIGAPTPFTEWELNVTDESAKGNLPRYVNETDGSITPWALCDGYSSYQLIVDFDGDDEQEILWTVPFPVVTDAKTGNIEGYYVNDQVSKSRRQESGGGWGDPDLDGQSEYVVELNGPNHPETLVYCFTADPPGKFPADAWWPEYYHSALPVDSTGRNYQAEASWLKLNGAYSNALWFPMELQVPEVLLPSIAAILLVGLLTRRK